MVRNLAMWWDFSPYTLVGIDVTVERRGQAESEDEDVINARFSDWTTRATFVRLNIKLCIILKIIFLTGLVLFVCFSPISYVSLARSLRTRYRRNSEAHSTLTISTSTLPTDQLTSWGCGQLMEVIHMRRHPNISPNETSLSNPTANWLFQSLSHVPS